MSPHWHLAIESSALGGSVSLFRSVDAPQAQPHDTPTTGVSDSSPPATQQQTQLQCQIVLPPEGGSVCTLAPAINALLKDYSMRVRELAFLSVTVGPGSFTGLRVGLATAKMLGLAADLLIVPIDTLELIAERFRFAQHDPAATPGRTTTQIRLVTAINAFRRQLFSANWVIDADDRLHCDAPAVVVDADRWQADPWGSTRHAASRSQDTPGDGAMWVTGPGLSVYKPTDPSVFIASPTIWSPMSEQMGPIAWSRFRAGQAVTADALSPNYIRSSAAEEKRKAEA